MGDILFRQDGNSWRYEHGLRDASLSSKSTSQKPLTELVKRCEITKDVIDVCLTMTLVGKKTFFKTCLSMRFNDESVTTVGEPQATHIVHVVRPINYP